MVGRLSLNLFQNFNSLWQHNNFVCERLEEGRDRCAWRKAGGEKLRQESRGSLSVYHKLYCSVPYIKNKLREFMNMLYIYHIFMLFFFRWNVVWKRGKYTQKVTSPVRISSVSKRDCSVFLAGWDLFFFYIYIYVGVSPCCVQWRDSHLAQMLEGFRCKDMSRCAFDNVAVETFGRGPLCPRGCRVRKQTATSLVLIPSMSARLVGRDSLAISVHPWSMTCRVK